MQTSFELIIFLLGMLPTPFPDDGEDALHIDIPQTIQRAQQGDRESVAVLYRIHVRMIFRYIAARVPTPSDAEDLTADVFIRMVEALPNYQITSAPFAAWLYRIAASQVSDFYRKQGNRPGENLLEHLTDSGVSQEDAVIEQQALDSLRRAMRQLSDDQQTILILRFVERKSHEEVALLLGKSVSAVKSAQHRALSHLTKLLGSDQKVRHYLRGDHE